jgi:hypothetical protein
MPNPARIHHLIAHGEDVAAFCNKRDCQHYARLPVALFLSNGATETTPVPDLQRWLRCTRCGGRDVQTRPYPYSHACRASGLTNAKGVTGRFLPAPVAPS